jgi:hypothetical protein
MGTFIFNLICIGLGLIFFIPWVKETTIAQTVLLGACRFFNGMYVLKQLIQCL